MKKHYTVAEFAKIKGISTTAVYKQFETTLKPFLMFVNGKKCVSAKYFEIYPLDDTNQVEHETNQEFETKTEGNSNKTIIDILSNQLTEKDKQIALLQQEISELRKESLSKDIFIQEQSSKLSLLLEQSQQLQASSQVLLLQEKRIETELETPTEEDSTQTQSIFSRIFKKEKRKKKGE